MVPDVSPKMAMVEVHRRVSKSRLEGPARWSRGLGAGRPSHLDQQRCWWSRCDEGGSKPHPARDGGWGAKSNPVVVEVRRRSLETTRDGRDGLTVDVLSSEAATDGQHDACGPVVSRLGRGAPFAPRPATVLVVEVRAERPRSPRPNGPAGGLEARARGALRTSTSNRLRDRGWGVSCSVRCQREDPGPGDARRALAR